MSAFASRRRRPPRAAAIAIAFSLGVLTSVAGAQSARRGRVLVANQQAASASLIDLATDSMRFIDVGIGPHEAVIAPSGRVGVVTIYGTQTPGNELAVIDLRSGTLTRKISLAQYTRPHGAMFLPGDETRVVVTSEATQKLLVVNLESGAVEAAIPTGAQGSHMVGLTRDGSRAWTSDVGTGAVSEMDLVRKALVRVIPTGPRTEGIAVAPDGSTVWAGSNANGTVSVIDTKSGAIVETLTGFSVPYRLAISADGKTAIICDPQGDAIHVADVATRKVVWKLESLGSPRGVTIAPDGTTAFVTLAADPAVGVIDLVAKKLVRKIGVGASPDGVGFGPPPG
jgi:DNA-binding beta-propeller fold protein YncE